MPAQPGEALFEFHAKSTERKPKGFEELITIEKPILGWRCGLPRPTPVTYSPYLDRGTSTYLYRMADGRFRDEWNDFGLFANFEAIKTYVMDIIQGRWPTNWAPGSSTPPGWDPKSTELPDFLNGTKDKGDGE